MNEAEAGTPTGRPASRPKTWRQKGAGLAFLLLLSGLVAVVQPSAWAAPPRCNVDVKGWPDCIPKHEDFVRTLQTPESARRSSGRGEG